MQGKSNLLITSIIKEIYYNKSVGWTYSVLRVDKNFQLESGFRVCFCSIIYSIKGIYMEITLPLAEMSTEDKIRTMETLWDDLSKKVENVASPFWHKEILMEREAGIGNSREEFIDWDEAKKQIENNIR